MADDPAVARWMSGGFSSPYTMERAREWIAQALRQSPVQFYAIEADGTIAGGAGIEPRDDSHAGVAIVGYWLASRYWGRGIATGALRELVRIGFDAGFRRLQAHVFEPNRASARVLEKCGFVCEGQLRSSYVQRDGTPCDELIYGLLSASKTPDS